MNQEVKVLAESTYSPENLAAAKRLQAEWKKLPPRKPREAQQIIRSFVFALDVVFEKSFLNRLSLSKYQDFEQKDVTGQKQIKISLLKDLIGRDQKELETIKENSEKFRTTGDDFESLLQRKIGAYKRKVDVKNHILQELLNK
jgi:hypothetical protein